MPPNDQKGAIQCAINEIKDMATFEKPHQYAVGTRFVLANGTVVVDQGKHTGARLGKILYGPGRRP